MHLYIDESGDNRFFLMAAVIVSSPDEARDPIRIARAFVKNHNRQTRRARERWNVAEFKEKELHRFPASLKEAVVEAITFKMNGKTREQRPLRISAVYTRTHRSSLNRDSLYVLMASQLLRQCLSSLDGDSYTITFDVFNDVFFQQRLYEKIRAAYPNSTLVLKHVDSQIVDGLQTADIVSGVLRRKLNGEDLTNYEKISPLIIEFREISSSV